MRMPSTLKVDGRSWLAEVQFVYQGLGGKGGRCVSSDRKQHVQRIQVRESMAPQE